jgi:hypothetical protein
MADQPAMKALVAYESMFGNTERVARAVAAGLRLEGVNTSVLDVSRAAVIHLAEVDLLVVGAPTHGFSLSRPATRRDAVRQGGRDDAAAYGMREWLETLADESRLPLVATFDTRVTKVRYLPASAARRAARILDAQGHQIVAAPTGFLVHATPGPLEPHEVDRAIAWGRGVGHESQSRLTPAH